MKRVSRKTQTANLQGKIEEWNTRAENADTQEIKDFCIKRITELEDRFHRYSLYGINPDKMIIEEYT